MLRPSLQSAPEPNALDLPPVSKHLCQMCGNFLRFLTSVDLDLSPLQVKIGTPLTPSLRNVYTNFIFFYILFSSYEPVRDRRMDVSVAV